MTTEIANRLCAYRKHHGLSQEELAEKLAVSRQAISKWERAESIPDAFVLTQLATIYGITVDDILRPADTWEQQQEKKKSAEEAQKRHFSAAVVTLVAIAGIWTMAVMMFVIFWLAMGSVQWLWLIFASAVPVSLIALLVFNSIWNHGKGNMYLVMILEAAVVALVYLFLLPFNPWQLFLILAPAELLTFLCFRIRLGLRGLFKKRKIC